MSFVRRINYFLVHTLKISNTEAKALIREGEVQIDGKVITEDCLITETSEIKISGILVRAGKKYIYLRFYKPVGFQSSLNPLVENNLSHFFSEQKDLSIAGRLDKQSEGLLILSNDGKWVEQLCNPKFCKEKEYVVTLDKTPDERFIFLFKNGVNIGKHVTKPCECMIIENNIINVVLTEGRNRQIRRMCRVLGYSVTALKRVRIEQFQLGGLLPGEKLPFNRSLQ